MKTGGRFAELTNEVWLLTIVLGFAAPGLRAWGDKSVSLAWDSSPIIDVIGYVVHYGGASKVYTNSLDVGDTTTATFRGLKEGMTYFFAVTAYDAVGLSSVPSNEVWYQVPIAVRDAGPSVQLTMGPQSDVGAQIRFPASPNKSYEIQATEDFQSWRTVWYSSPVDKMRWIEFSDIDTTASGTRFYRLVVH